MTDVGFPATDDDERWKREADDLRHEGLAQVREAAAKWHDSIAVVLGAFSVVAFVKGPETFSNQQFSVALIAATAVVLAVVCASIATVLAALAAQGSPRIVGRLTGPSLRAYTVTSLEKATRQVRASRLLTVVAALLITVGVSVTWYADILGDDGASNGEPTASQSE